MMRRALNRLLREPLAHFMIAGFILFLLVEVFASDQNLSNDPREIVVDQTALTNHLLYQSRASDATQAQATLEALHPDGREQLIADYVTDEVLYREARALGLDENDEVIRRRLIQMLDFATRSFMAGTTTISEVEVQEYFSAHIDDYRIDPSVTFTHVFLDARKHGADRAVLLAEKTLDRLNANRVPFELASRHGDRFHFHRNYVDRTPEYVQSHFGSHMAAQVFDLSPSTNRWRGPFVSPYGAHLVMVTRISPGRIPELEEVANFVWEDARRAKLEDARKAAYEKWISRYRVRREL
jgi:hypothetical protein